MLVNPSKSSAIASIIYPISLRHLLCPFTNIPGFILIEFNTIKLPELIAWVAIPTRVLIASLTFVQDVGLTLEVVPIPGFGSAVIVKSFTFSWFVIAFLAYSRAETNAYTDSDSSPNNAVVADPTLSK